MPPSCFRGRPTTSELEGPCAWNLRERNPTRSPKHSSSTLNPKKQKQLRPAHRAAISCSWPPSHVSGRRIRRLQDPKFGLRGPESRGSGLKIRDLCVQCESKGFEKPCAQVKRLKRACLGCPKGGGKRPLKPRSCEPLSEISPLRAVARRAMGARGKLGVRGVERVLGQSQKSFYSKGWVSGLRC